MGLAVAGVLRVSEWVGGLSGSTVLVPAFGAGALALLALALLVLTLLSSPLRWAAVLPAACGVGLAATAERSDVLIDRAGSGAAVRGADGRLAVLGRPSSFVVEQWLKADGDRRSPDDPTLRAAARCDALGCNIADAGGRVVALVSNRRALLEDCERATAVLTPLTIPPTCRAHLVIDGRFLATYGATAVRWTSSEAVITTARRPELNRPWMRLPVQTAAGAQAGPMPDRRRIPPRRPAPPSRDPLDPPLDDGQPSAPERPDQ
jgi:competence protein ComEC